MLDLLLCVKDFGGEFLKKIEYFFEKEKDFNCRCKNNLYCDQPKKWLGYVFELIQQENAQTKICSTRRGGGLPFFVQAIVASELSESGRYTLEYSMKTLLKLAEPTYENDSKNFTKVLAMYILASLFKDTRIGEEVLKFAENVIMVAINGFDSKYWNVRNASTILYSSLLNRIFGVSRSRDEISKKNR